MLPPAHVSVFPVLPPNKSITSLAMKNGFVSYGAISQKELPLHRNVGMEVVLVKEGRLRWVVDGRIENVTAGMVFFTLPWQAHGSTYAREPGNLLEFVQFRLDQSHRKAVRSFGFAPPLDIPTAKARELSRIFCGASQHAWPSTPNLRWVLRALVEQLEQETNQLMLQGIFRTMIVELSNIVSGLSLAPESAPNETVRRVESLIAQMETSCHEAWPLARLLAQSRLGKTQLSEVFKRQTGDSPQVFLHRARITKAESLLRETDLSVTDIAFDCGYPTLQNFCATFKRLTNHTPTELRHIDNARESPSVLDLTERDEAES